jgi:hypothetical protein
LSIPTPKFASKLVFLCGFTQNSDLRGFLTYFTLQTCRFALFIAIFVVRSV